MAEQDINTFNRYLVSRAGPTVRIMNPDLGRMPLDQAMLLAAWLVALADDSPGHTRFAEVLAAVEAT